MESNGNIKNDKKVIDELIKEIDKMIQEGKPKNEIDEKIKKLEVLLESYLKNKHNI